MAVTNADILGWLNENPNASPALINQTMAEAGVSAAQYQSATGAPPPPPPPPAPTTITELYQQELGRAPESKKVIEEWEKIFGSTIDPTEVAQFQQAAQLEKTAPAIANIKGQILAQGTTDQWSGQGFGSAEANAADMARMLASAGITDINQFGEIQKTVVDEEGNNVVVKTFGNKVTGQEIANNYETGSNAFGGTYAGKGNTGYRVEFAPNGTPVFYTTGASSSDSSQWMPFVQLALAASGAGGLLGSALLGAGASQVAAGALGNAILGGATTGIAGGDALTGALLGGAGGALGGYLQGGSLDGLGITERQFAIADATQLAEQGLSSSQIRDALIAGGYNDAIIDRALNALTPSATVTNPVVDNNTVSITGTPAISTDIPTVITTANRPQKVSPEIVNAVNSLISGGNVETQTIEIKDKRPTKPDIPVVTVTDPNAPTAKNPIAPDAPITPPNKDTKLTVPDLIRIIGIGGTIAGIGAAATPTTPTGPQYPIIDVPTDWRTPPKTGVAPFAGLPPINFGNRNLLIGTQWEKFLDPNYGQVPEPIQYSQPSSLSYNDLMGILGNKQGMPSASNLSINDIISGIQNQYGQAPTRTMG